MNKANTRSLPGADIGSDHDLVLTTIKLKLITMKSPCIQFDLKKLTDLKIAEVVSQPDTKIGLGTFPISWFVAYLKN